MKPGAPTGAELAEGAGIGKNSFRTITKIIIAMTNAITCIGDRTNRLLYSSS